MKGKLICGVHFLPYVLLPARALRMYVCFLLLLRLSEQYYIKYFVPLHQRLLYKSSACVEELCLLLLNGHNIRLYVYVYCMLYIFNASVTVMAFLSLFLSQSFHSCALFLDTSLFNLFPWFVLVCSQFVNSFDVCSFVCFHLHMFRKCWRFKQIC